MKMQNQSTEAIEMIRTIRHRAEERRVCVECGKCIDIQEPYETTYQGQEVWHTCVYCLCARDMIEMTMPEFSCYMGELWLAIRSLIPKARECSPGIGMAIGRIAIERKRNVEEMFNRRKDWDLIWLQK